MNYAFHIDLVHDKWHAMYSAPEPTKRADWWGLNVGKSGENSAIILKSMMKQNLLNT